MNHFLFSENENKYLAPPCGSKDQLQLETGLVSTTGSGQLNTAPDCNEPEAETLP